MLIFQVFYLLHFLHNIHHRSYYKYFVDSVYRGIFDTPGFHIISSKSIDEALNKLSVIEREILQCRYGLLDGKSMSLDTVKEHYAEKNYTRERVRQKEAKAIIVLNAFFNLFSNTKKLINKAINVMPHESG